MKKRLSITLVLMLLVFSGLFFFARHEGYKLVNNPVQSRLFSSRTPAALGLPYTVVTVTAADGLELFGWFIPAPDGGNGGTIMLQHGYKVYPSSVLEEALLFHQHGYNAVVTGIRGHDFSDGELITWGIEETKDLDAWYRYLLTRSDVDPDKIGGYGKSYGGSLMIKYAAQNKQIKAVAVQSPFASIHNSAAAAVKNISGLPAFPFAPMIVYWGESGAQIQAEDVDATKWIKGICGRPILIMQGTRPGQPISDDSGRLLYDAACEPKELWIEPELGHTDFHSLRAVEFEERVTGLFDAWVLGKTTTSVSSDQHSLRQQ